MFGGTVGVLVLVVGIVVVLAVVVVALALQARRVRRRPSTARSPWPRAAGRRDEATTTRLPFDRGPVPGGPIDSTAAQRDPDTVVTRRDDPPGSLFEPSAPEDPPPR